MFYTRFGIRFESYWYLGYYWHIFSDQRIALFLLDLNMTSIWTDVADEKLRPECIYVTKQMSNLNLPKWIQDSQSHQPACLRAGMGKNWEPENMRAYGGFANELPKNKYLII